MSFKSISFARLSVVLLLASQSSFTFAADKFIEPTMVNISGGEVIMNTEANATKTPKTFSIKPFRMGKYEVTGAEFKKFIAATNYSTPTKCMQMNSKEWFKDTPAAWDKRNHLASDFEPVTCIGWDAAQAYVQWLSKETGKHYRLPSNTEWEYAARAGTTTTWYWGDDAAQACPYANIADQAAEAAIKRDYDGLESKDHVGVVPCNDKSGYASVVGLYEPNAFGLYDMVGNIMEFTQDCYEGDCTKRTVRGANWHWQPSVMFGGFPANWIGSLEGFRIVEDISSEHACAQPESKACKKLSRKSKFDRELAKAQKAARKNF
ncbi:MAG: SUMF1/EgtB/PvdO family nonheme iron enzyme [Pseudomonadota bacterium]|nr:SUMF1/EgtB/PvdO family nonheme iron enzyme [Pseudomonadota bacterium]